MLPKTAGDGHMGPVTDLHTTSLAEEFIICTQCHHPIEVTSGSLEPPLVASTPHISRSRRRSLSPRPLPGCAPISDCSYTSDSTEEFQTCIMSTSDNSATCRIPVQDLESSEEFESSVLDNLETSMMGYRRPSLCKNCSLQMSYETETQTKKQRDSGIHNPAGVNQPAALNQDSIPVQWDLDIPRERLSCSESDRMSDDSAFDSDDAHAADEGESRNQEMTSTVQCRTDFSEYVIIEDVPEDPGIDASERVIPYCTTHRQHQTIAYCATCEQTICVLCWSLTHATHNVSSMLPVTTGHTTVDSLTGYLDGIQEQISHYELSLTKHHRDVQCHLEARKRYYTELVERWFWKNRIVLETEYQKEAAQIQKVSNMVQDVRKTFLDLEVRVKNVLDQTRQQVSQLQQEEVAIVDDLTRMKDSIQNIGGSTCTWHQMGFTVGRCLRLQYEDLGPLVPHRKWSTVSQVTSSTDPADEPVSTDGDYVVISTVDAQTTSEQISDIPPSVFPSKCLHQFDSRHGYSSDYMATGISLTMTGDLLITDMGMNTVQVFSSSGSWRKELMIAPDDQPTNAVHFTKNVIAVATASSVKLYDLSDGIYCDRQLVGALDRPQGLAMSCDGDLVVSGFRSDLPAVAFYDRASYRMKDVIFGRSQCAEVEEDVISGASDVNDAVELFSSPWYVTTNNTDKVTFSNRDDHSVKTVTPDSELLADVGCQGLRSGRFQHPAGLCSDSAGRILVADSHNHRVQLILPECNSAIVLLNQEQDNLECPMDVALDADGRLYVLQSNGVVKVFQYC